MTLSLEVAPDAATAARSVASLVGDRARKLVQEHGRFSLALSKVPSAMLRALATDDLPWSEMRVYQVDERVAPAGHADRNLTAFSSSLPPEARASLQPMPVDDADLEEAARSYAMQLPGLLDLVHLGLGADGHTASLVPGDPALEVRDRLVAVTGKYEGRRRMTLTYPALDSAREILWLVTGETKRDALARLLARDVSIPAARIANPRQRIVADEAAMPAS